MDGTGWPASQSTQPKSNTILRRAGEEFSRRRALYITPLVFTGLLALSSRRDATPPVGAEEIAIIECDRAGHKTKVRRQRVLLSESEWRSRLTQNQFYVTRKGSTDTPFTGTYYQLHDPGIFRCVCCGTALFTSDAKFDSGTGWPSFWEPVAQENVRTRTDTSMFLERVEVLCALCDAHLGHVFPDGPPPTGLRYCINESSLRFEPRT